jgi:hypothetical protein
MDVLAMPALIFVAGFAAGFLTRAYISRRRHASMRRRRGDF